MSGSSTPTSIDVGEQPFDLSFHPSQDVLAVALISGYLHMCVVYARCRAR